MIDMSEHSTAKRTSLPRFPTDSLRDEDSSWLALKFKIIQITFYGGNRLYPAGARSSLDPAAFQLISSFPDNPDAR